MLDLCFASGTCPPVIPPPQERRGKALFEDQNYGATCTITVVTCLEPRDYSPQADASLNGDFDIIFGGPVDTKMHVATRMTPPFFSGSTGRVFKSILRVKNYRVDQL